ncbi:MAG: TldD/PmbA family protein [Candidatus Eremiobacterota bacterium]
MDNIENTKNTEENAPENTEKEVSKTSEKEEIRGYKDFADAYCPEGEQKLPPDEYHLLKNDFAQINNRGFKSFQESTPGREIDWIGLYMGSRYGTVITTDERGIPQVKTSGNEFTPQGERRIQRFFIGLRGEVATKDFSVQSVNLSGNDTIVKEFEVNSAGYKLIKNIIEDAQKKGEQVQRKIDEEDEPFFPFYHSPEKNILSINRNIEEGVNLDLAVNLVANARQVVKQEMGAKVKDIKVTFFKIADVIEYADTDGNMIDTVTPRVGIAIQVETKDNNKAFGAIRGAMGGTEILKRSEEDADKDYVEIVRALAKEVSKDAIDLDRAQSTSILGSECPVVLSSGVTGVLAHEVYGHSSEADVIITNKKTKAAEINLKGRIGGQVSENTKFNIIDTGLCSFDVGKKKIRNAFGGIVVDEHGTIPKRTALIQDGVQKLVLNSRYTRNEIMDGLTGDIRDEMERHGLSGNVRTEKYDKPPLVRMTNTYILPDDENGKDKLEDIIALVPKSKKGVYLKTCDGGWVETNTGEFQISGRLGFLIENGVLTDKPIRDIKISGNLNKFGAKIKHIGSSKTMDRVFTGYCGKRGQMVPTESGGPILYVEDVKLQGGGKRYFERTVREYLRQHEEIEKGMRTKDNVYIREVDEDSDMDLTDQENLCVVTTSLPLEKEVRILLGKDINSDYLLGLEGDIIKNTDVYDR